MGPDKTAENARSAQATARARSGARAPTEQAKTGRGRAATIAQGSPPEHAQGKSGVNSLAAAAPPVAAAATDQHLIQVQIVAPPLMAWGLARLVQEAGPAWQLLGQHATVAECLPNLLPDSPQVVLLDLEGPDTLDTLIILAERSLVKVLVLTAWHQGEMQDRAILAGARGVVSKTETPATLLKAMERINQGEIWVDRNATGRIFMQLVKRQSAEQTSDPAFHKIASLTRRERQTVTVLASDASAPGKVLASRLNISENTLRNHLTTIYDKLGVSNRLDLYAFAQRHGLGDSAAH